MYVVQNYQNKDREMSIVAQAKWDLMAEEEKDREKI